MPPAIMAGAAVVGAGASIYAASQAGKGGDVSRGGASGIPNLFPGIGYDFSHNAEAAAFLRKGLAAEIPGRLVGISDRIGGLGDRLLSDTLPKLAPIRAGLTGLGGDIQGLRAQVTPGFGRLTEARVKAIRDAGAESIGNLRDSLARRNVMGSSFANDAVTRTRLAYAQEEERARAEAVVQEIGLSQQLLQEQAANYGQQLGLSQEERAIIGQAVQAYTGQAQILANQADRELQEFAVSSNALNGVSSTIAQQGIAQAQLDALANAQTSFNRGALAQQLPGLVGQFTGGLQTLFGGSGGPPGMYAGGTGVNPVSGLAVGGV